MNKNILFATISSVLFASCTHNQDKHITELFTKQPAAYAKTRDAWIVEQSLGNPSNSFSLEIEMGEAAHLRAKSIPPGERFIFASIDPIREKIEVPFEFEIEGGLLKIYDRNGVRVQNEIPLVSTEPLLLGKPRIYALVSKETYSIATVEFLPFPIAAESETGARLSLAVTHPMLTRFQLAASGFTPGEKVHLTHRSGERTEEIQMFANAEGTFSFGVNPTILGRLGGEASLTAVRENSEEIVLDYPWGSQLEVEAFRQNTRIPIVFSLKN